MLVADRRGAQKIASSLAVAVNFSTSEHYVSRLFYHVFGLHMLILIPFYAFRPDLSKPYKDS
jgi:AraC-like DNA-binding protein